LPDFDVGSRSGRLEGRKERMGGQRGERKKHHRSPLLLVLLMGIWWHILRNGPFEAAQDVDPVGVANIKVACNLVLLTAIPLVSTPTTCAFNAPFRSDARTNIGLVFM